MGSEAVGILNVPGQGSVSLFYVPESGMFQADVAGSPLVHVSRIRAADKENLITWHRAGFLESLSADGMLPRPATIESAPLIGDEDEQRSESVADDMAAAPLAGIDLDSLGGDPVPKGVSPSSIPVREAESPGEAPSGGIGTMPTPGGRKVSDGFRGIRDRYSASSPDSGMKKVVQIVVSGAIILAVAAVFLIPAYRMIVRGFSSDSGTSARESAGTAKDADAAVATGVGDAVAGYAEGIAAGDQKAAGKHADIKAISAALAASYAAIAKEEQGLTPKQLAEVRSGYAAVLIKQEAEAAAAKDPSMSLIGGGLARVISDGTGGPFAVLEPTGKIGVRMVLVARKSGKEWRLVKLDNPDEIAASIAGASPIK